jgi:hypothetical protein
MQVLVRVLESGAELQLTGTLAIAGGHVADAAVEAGNLRPPG